MDRANKDTALVMKGLACILPQAHSKLNNVELVNFNAGAKRLAALFDQTAGIIGEPLRLVSHNDLYFVPYHEVRNVFQDGLFLPNGKIWRASATIHTKEEQHFVKSKSTLSIDRYDFKTVDYPVLYLGFLSGHYGHFLLESLSRCWVLLENWRDYGGKVLFHRDKDHSGLDDLPIWARDLLDCMDLAESDFVCSDEPLLLKNVTVPDPMFKIRSMAHEGLANFFSYFRKMLMPGNCEKSTRPLYLSRTRLGTGQRKIAGEKYLENLLENSGFEIFHPQEKSIKDQIIKFNQHDTIVGFQGSAFHNILFADKPKKNIIFTRANPNANFVLCDQLNQANSTYINAVKAVSHPLLPSDWNCPCVPDIPLILAWLQKSKLLEEDLVPVGYVDAVGEELNEIWREISSDLQGPAE